MYSRRLLRLLAAGATSAAALASGTPASASVTYDPVTKAGFVDRSDVRSAFGWTDRVLASRAAGLVFGHDFWTDDTYSVACGGPAFPVVHHREYGNFELTDTLSPAGYGGEPAGFRLTGAHSGISGTSVPPMVGQPCPAADQGATVDQARLVSSTTGWALTVSSLGVRRDLLVNGVAGQRGGASA
jgi:hypothetical protein